MKKLALFTAVLGGFGLSHALEFKTDFLGTLKLEGALTGYIIHSNNTSDNKKTRYDVGSAIISISKPAEPFGFTLMGGAYATPVVGAGLSKTSESTDLFSPLPVAYLEYAPMKGLSVQVGKLPTIIGYEAAFTYMNNYIQRGLVWNMQPVINNGFRVTYSADLFTVKAGINDGFYTLSSSDPKPAIEGSVSLTPMKDASIALNFLIPDKSSQPNPTVFPANKREFNLVGSYGMGPVGLAFDLMYVEAPADADAGVAEKAKATGGAIHLSYDLKPIKLAGRLEYFNDDSDIGTVDLVGLGDGNKGYSFTLTPSFSKGGIIVRGELSFVNADNAFTSNGKKSQARVGIELGFLF